MIIDGRKIGPDQQPYIIAEISCNHNGVLDNAMKLIEAAKNAGADAVKFQAYTADTITINPFDTQAGDFYIREGLWKGRSLHELYSKTQTPFEWFPTLFTYARDIGITPFASVFDKSSVDMLEKLHCPAYKIASMEITDLPLIRYVRSKGRPMIISTGMASNQEIHDASYAADMGLGNNSIFLACTSGYPMGIEASNLDRLRYLQQYAFLSGLSDHTLGHIIPSAAVAMGACVIEKHLMLGLEHTEDYDFSMEEHSFRVMVATINKVWRALQPKTHDAESASRQLRRSLYIVQDIKAGEPFTEENVRSIRPAYGMEPGKLPWVLTKVAAVDLQRGTALKPEHLTSLKISS